MEMNGGKKKFKRNHTPFSDDSSIEFFSIKLASLINEEKLLLLMENAFNYVTEDRPKMQGGDSRYNRSRGDLLFKEANPDLELEAKNKRVTDKVSENMNIIANEPSLAFFRIQEHVRKCLPQLVETKHEVQTIQQSVQGASFDAEYAANAVKEMHKSAGHFQGIQDLLKNAMFMKQQIDYEHSRRKNPHLKPSPTPYDIQKDTNEDDIQN